MKVEGIVRPQVLRNLVWLLVLAVSSPSRAQGNASKEDWIPLFNGKDLSGWDIKITGHDLNENFGNTFRVEGAVLKVSYDQYKEFANKFGHLYYQKPFSYYKLRVEYRFVGEQLKGGAVWNVRNSGVMLHSQPASSLLKDQAFPVSLEMQLLGELSDGNPRTTANLCTPGTMIEMNGKLNTDHCINSTSRTYDGDQWVKVEAVVYGDSLIQHTVDGKVVVEYQKPRVGEVGEFKKYFMEGWGNQHEGMLLKEGSIALQAESHPIEFRKVELLNLKGCMNPKCAQYKTYYVVAGECDCNK